MVLRANLSSTFTGVASTNVSVLFNSQWATGYYRQLRLLGCSCPVSGVHTIPIHRDGLRFLKLHSLTRTSLVVFSSWCFPAFFPYKKTTDFSVVLRAKRRPTLTGGSPQLPSALESLTSVFGMGTGVTSLPSSLHYWKIVLSKLINVSLKFKVLWLSPRPISIRQLHTSPHFHLEPIYLIVFQGSYLLA